MSQQPIIFLAFANDQDVYLSQLKKESKAIFRALAPWEEQSAFRIHREESADTAAITQAVNQFDGRILLFHFAGHANGQQISLEDAKGHVTGLAALLGRQTILKLVFLNGCSTSEQVHQLLQYHIPVVIATKSTVSDARATAFATYFYEKLALSGTIQEAFDHASDCLLLKYGDVERPVKRVMPMDRQLAIESEKGELDMPWGLYYRKENENILDWKLTGNNQNKFGLKSELGFLLILLMASLLFLLKDQFLSSGMENLHLRLLADQISFIPKENKPILYPHEHILKRFKVEFFDESWIEGSLPTTNTEFSTPLHILPRSGQRSRPFLSLEQVVLKALQMRANSRINLQHNLGNIQITGTFGPIKGYFTGETRCTAGDVSVGEKEYTNPRFDQKLRASSSGISNFTINNKTSSELLLEINPGYSFLTEGPIKIQDLKFLRAPKFQSSIRSGEIVIGDTTLSLGPGEAISSDLIEHMVIHQMKIDSQGITILCKGKIALPNVQHLIKIVQ